MRVNASVEDGGGEGVARCDELVCFVDLGQKHQNMLTALKQFPHKGEG